MRNIAEDYLFGRIRVNYYSRLQNTLFSSSGITLNSQVDLRERMQSSVVHRGRHLMSMSELDEFSAARPGHADTVDWLHRLILEYGSGGSGKMNLTDVPPMCPMYFNKTESMRYADL